MQVKWKTRTSFALLEGIGSIKLRKYAFWYVWYDATIKSRRRSSLPPLPPLRNTSHEQRKLQALALPYSILRLRAVCVRWPGLVSDGYFIAAFSLASPPHPAVLFRSVPRPHLSFLPLLHDSSPTLVVSVARPCSSRRYSTVFRSA